MQPTLPSKKIELFQSLINTQILSVRRHIFKSDRDLENFEQLADGTTEIKFNNNKIVCFVALAEANSVGVCEEKLQDPGSSYIILDLTANHFWQTRINQPIQKIEVIKSEYASENNPSEFAVEFQLKNGKCVCIEYLDEEEFPDTIRVIDKYEGGQCTRLKFS